MRLLNLMICVLITSVNYTAKAYTIIRNEKYLREILRDLECVAFNVHSIELNRYIQIIHNITKMLLRYFIFTLTLYMAVRSILPLVVNVSMIVPVPFNMGKLDILYKVVHFFATASASFNTIAFDVLYLTLMNICIAQLHILQEKLRNVFESVGSSRGTRLTAYNIMKQCVILHETINQYVKKLNVFLSFPLFVQYTCGCFILCNTILQLQMSGISDSVNMLGVCLFFSVTFGQMAAFHYLGNEILYKSNKIIEASCNSKWYKLDMKSQRALLVLMERAKRPLVIQVYNYISISLDSLGAIFRYAYSVFAVLKAGYS